MIQMFMPLVTILSLLCGATASAGEQQPAKRVVVTPEETDEILANPGMGWQTFHRTSKQDKSLPPWIPSTVHYARWGWGELEPQPGKLNTEFLDKVLKETHDAGQKLAFRVMTCSTSLNSPYHPKWVTRSRRQGVDCRLRRPRSVSHPRHGRPHRAGTPSRLHQAAGRAV